MEKNQNKSIKEEKIKDKTRNRSRVFGSVAAVTIVVVIAIVVVFNIIFSNLVTAQIDLTQNKDFSMTEEAKEFLKDVDEEVEIVGLFDEVKKDLGVSASGMESTYFTDLYLVGQLHEGTYYGTMYTQLFGYSLPLMSVDSVMGILNQFTQVNSNIKVSYVDPEANPLFIRNYLGDSEKASEFQKGDFIVKCGDTFKRVTSADLTRKVIDTSTYGTKVYLPYAPNVDGGFLSAILYVTADKRPVVGVAVNHGELSMEDGFSTLSSALQDNAFEIEEFDMALASDLTKYDIIFMINPLSDITVSEGDALTSYLSGSGNLVVMVDPNENSQEYNNLNFVLENFNLKINNDLIEGAASETLEGFGLYLPTIVTSTGPTADVITESENLIVPKARSISYLNKTISDLESNILIRTGNSAVSYDYTSGEETATGSKYVSVVSYLYNGGDEAKVMVTGSSSMFMDTCQTSDAAVEAVAKICAWMEKSVSYTLPVKRIDAAAITVTESSANLIGILCIVLFPLLTVTIGLFIWLRRRHL